MENDMCLTTAVAEDPYNICGSNNITEGHRRIFMFKSPLSFVEFLRSASGSGSGLVAGKIYEHSGPVMEQARHAVGRVADTAFVRRVAALEFVGYTNMENPDLDSLFKPPINRPPSKSAASLNSPLLTFNPNNFFIPQ
ncbi:hypothetical protein BDZ45DRAFT_803321 [Acephala macrosclerotiorum]|nr:hypothetical protein BDZ45DRAFT_803321 [Acephala macrosclerotiorum]